MKTNKPTIEKSNNADAPSINIDYLTLRRYLGILGILLPFILIIGHELQIESSISHYYYTNMSVIFTGTLVAFGLFLISYNGYVKKSDEFLSDNLITNCAGVLAFLVAIIPTACAACDTNMANGHNNHILNAIHLGSAGLFLAIMGYMSFIQFVKSDKKDALTMRRKMCFRLSGIVIWLMVLFLLLEFIFKFNFTAIDTLIAESIALFFFGTAWLVKSESLEKIGL